MAQEVSIHGVRIILLVLCSSLFSYVDVLLKLLAGHETTSS